MIVIGCPSPHRVRGGAIPGAGGGAGERIRTADLLITSEPLYRLSYTGFRPAPDILPPERRGANRGCRGAAAPAGQMYSGTHPCRRLIDSVTSCSSASSAAWPSGEESTCLKRPCISR